VLPRQLGCLHRVSTLRNREDIEAGGLPDLTHVPAKLLAVLRQDLQLLLRRRRVTAANVAGIAILRDQLERHLRATAADPERNLVARLVALRLVDRAVDGVVLAF